MRRRRPRLLVALIANAEIESAQLEALVVRYRSKYISDVLPDTEGLKQDSVMVPMLGGDVPPRPPAENE